MRLGALILFLLTLVPVCAQDALREDERLQFADGLYARKMNELAIKEYQTFLADFPDTPKADLVHFRMGECYRLLGDRAAADREFRTVFTGYAGSPIRFKAGMRRAPIICRKQN